MKTVNYFLLATLALCGPLAMAGASALQFTAEEIAEDNYKALEISQGAAACLHEQENIHLKFYEEHNPHYSKFFGNRNPKHKTPDRRKLVLLKILRPNLFSEADKAAIEKLKIVTLTTPDKDEDGNIIAPSFESYIREVNTAAYQEIQRMKPELARRERELVASSCVGLTMRCLGVGFKGAGMGDTWEKIRSYVAINNNFYGTDLLKALVDLGWTSVYWNPDPSQNAIWDKEDQTLNPLEKGRKWMPVWGQHTAYYNGAMRASNPRYFGIPIQDNRTLVGFLKQPPLRFQRVPFFAGIAHGGYHVFPGTMGQIIEAHSMRALSSKDNLEFSSFNPLDQDHHGGPRWTNSEHYRSGVIVIPPGMLNYR